MLFSLNDFLIAVSFALDFMEKDRLGMQSNHGKRTAYLTVCIARRMNLSEEEIYDAAALSILHDNGLSESSLYEDLPGEWDHAVTRFEGSRGHCMIGEKNIKDYPFLTKPQDVILYHHERYDGNGYFGLKGDDIPLISQIIAAADSFENYFKFADGDYSHEEVLKWLSICQAGMVCPRLAKVLQLMVEDQSVWANLSNDRIEQALDEVVPSFEMDISLDKIRQVTGVFSRIVDCKSSFTRRHSKGLAEKAARMAEYYNKDQEETARLIIAADLHDLGKLAVPNSILDVPRALTPEEFETVKKHVYYTRVALENIRGFEDITEWAANHHEKLNGKGYPFGKTGVELDFNSRMMGCLDVYQALTEDRPYRAGMPHSQAVKVLSDMADNGFVDSGITKDIDQAFSSV
ncbi:HD-GYP domain-containing protein [Lacrimispora sp. AGF001]|jgi:HD-GYP domain-containing protein (c-di-GMP phosphodiesterase class II)|uniref:HD-GYP domain-containing protein n=1 Tax=Lacrimispora sp. AGF001 TaxID=3401631 RepID=UPI003B428655|nr:HD domain-containing protein [Paenibacillaceae bacterium]